MSTLTRDIRGDQDAVYSMHRSSIVTRVVESVVVPVLVPVTAVVVSIVVAGASEDMIGESIEA